MFFPDQIGVRLGLLLICCSLCIPAYSSHFVGGEISYTTTGNGVYSVTLTMYKDCGSGTAGYPNSISLSMIDPISGNTLSSVTLSPGSEISIPIPLMPPVYPIYPHSALVKKFIPVH